jgi:hypothetical protein
MILADVPAKRFFQKVVFHSVPSPKMKYRAAKEFSHDRLFAMNPILIISLDRVLQMGSFQHRRIFEGRECISKYDMPPIPGVGTRRQEIFVFLLCQGAHPGIFRMNDFQRRHETRQVGDDHAVRIRVLFTQAAKSSALSDECRAMPIEPAHQCAAQNPILLVLLRREFPQIETSPKVLMLLCKVAQVSGPFPPGHRFPPVADPGSVVSAIIFVCPLSIILFSPHTHSSRNGARSSSGILRRASGKLSGSNTAEFPSIRLLYAPTLSDECPDRGGCRVRRTNVKTFTIDNKTNNIIIHASANEAEAVPDAESFREEGELTNLAANWPTARLIEIWNSLPGQTQVRKFKDRASAISRMWKAIQNLGEATPVASAEHPLPSETALVSDPLPDAPDGQNQESNDTVQPEAVISEDPESGAVAHVAPPAPDVATRKAPARNKATRARKAIAPVPTTDFSVPREGTKTSQVIAMLKREGGTTLEEIMTEMEWQKHTTRAMLSAGGSLTKKHGLVITSEKRGDQRTYSIKT